MRCVLNNPAEPRARPCRTRAAHSTLTALYRRTQASPTSRRRSAEEYLIFIDSHAARIHFTDGRIVFDNPADFKTSQELSERVNADRKLQPCGCLAKFFVNAC